MKYDVIVIGAGLGGLTAGAKLAREGMKVLVIEQHSQPGGCATSFRRGDFTLEVGLHEMDGPGNRDMKNRIFSELAVTGNIEFLRVPEFYRFIRGDLAVTVPHDPQLAAARLTEARSTSRFFVLADGTCCSRWGSVLVAPGACSMTG